MTSQFAHFKDKFHVKQSQISKTECFENKQNYQGSRPSGVELIADVHQIT